MTECTAGPAMRFQVKKCVARTSPEIVNFSHDLYEHKHNPAGGFFKFKLAVNLKQTSRRAGRPISWHRNQLRSWPRSPLNLKIVLAVRIIDNL